MFGKRNRVACFGYAILAATVSELRAEWRCNRRAFARSDTRALAALLARSQAVGRDWRAAIGPEHCSGCHKLKQCGIFLLPRDEQNLSIMSLLKAFGINVQSDITKRLNEITIDYAASATTDCFNDAEMKLGLLIQRSKVNVKGDFEITQKAKLAFSCLQQQENAGELLQDLQDRMKKTLMQEIDEGGLISSGNANISISSTDLKTIIDNSVNLNVSGLCQASVDQNIDIRIIDSEFTVGCTSDDLQIASNLCKMYVTNPELTNLASSCDAVANCLTDRSKFLVGQGLEFTAACEQVQNIAAEIAQKVVQVAEIEQTQEVTTRGFADFIWYIVGGILLIIVVVALVRAFSSKRSGSQQNRRYAQATYDPRSYGPGYGTGTSYDSRMSSYYS